MPWHEGQASNGAVVGGCVEEGENSPALTKGEAAVLRRQWKAPAQCSRRWWRCVLRAQCRYGVVEMKWSSDCAGSSVSLGLPEEMVFLVSVRRGRLLLCIGRLVNV